MANKGTAKRIHSFELSITCNLCFYCRKYLEQESMEKRKMEFDYNNWNLFAVDVSEVFAYNALVGKEFVSDCHWHVGHG